MTTVWICAGVAAALLCLALLYYFGEGMGKLKAAKKHQAIPGLAEGFTPQGLCFAKAAGALLVSGYMKNKKQQSRIYVLSLAEDEPVKFVVAQQDKREVVGHFGGIACSGENVWISTDGQVLRLSLQDIKNAKNGENVDIIDSFCPKNGADFCFVNSGMLWIGEFYKLGKFRTDISHHVKVDEKNQFHAMCYGFKISPGQKCAVAKRQPEMAMSVPDLTQGICVFGDRIFTSASYGISRSQLSVFENVLLKPAASYTYFDEAKIPLYMLKKENLTAKFYLPSMSEEIDIVGDELFVLFESAAKKYRCFTRKKLKNIFGIFVNKL